MTYIIDLLTGDPGQAPAEAGVDEPQTVDDYDTAVGLAQAFYFQVACDDAEHVVAIWTQDAEYHSDDLVGLVFAGQLFVPERK